MLGAHIGAAQSRAESTTEARSLRRKSRAPRILGIRRARVWATLRAFLEAYLMCRVPVIQLLMIMPRSFAELAKGTSCPSRETLMWRSRFRPFRKIACDSVTGSRASKVLSRDESGLSALLLSGWTVGSLLDGGKTTSV